MSIHEIGRGIGGQAMTNEVGDTVIRQEAIDALMDEFKRVPTNAIRAKDVLEKLSSAQPEYEPVKAEDFAKTMSENMLYGFMAWHGEALELMERQGFVICKKKER